MMSIVCPSSAACAMKSASGCADSSSAKINEHLWQKFHRTLADHLAACERELRLRGKAAQCPVIVEIAQIAHSSQSVTRKDKKPWKR